MKMERDLAWKIVRRWKKALKLKPSAERERVMVDALLFEVNGRGNNRVSYGAMKKAVLKYATRYDSFTADLLMESGVLPSLTTRRSLVADLDSLCKRGFLKCITSSRRGRTGSPKVYAVVGGDNKA